MMQMDGMMIFKCGFIFKMSCHAIPHIAWHCQAIWGMARQSNSAVGIGQFGYEIMIERWKQLQQGNAKQSQQE